MELVELMMNWIDQGYKSVKIKPGHPNKFDTKSNLNDIPANEDGVTLWNSLIDQLRGCNDYLEAKKTPSGGICINEHPYKGVFYENTNTYFCITVFCGSCMIGFSIGYKIDGKHKSGRIAFIQYINELKKDGINIKDYAIENGKEIKATIPMPYIYFNKDLIETHCIVENAHHADFHSSYPAGLMNTHPEFTKTNERLFALRKGKGSAKYKDMLDMSIGYMQSKYINYKYAQLSKDAIEDNNRRIRALCDIIEEEGGKVLGCNTDGVWYQSEFPIYGKGYGDGIGYWHNDHINCKLRVKSKGAYEFIENGKYTPVVRGISKLDLIKPRNKWKWGDIMNVSNVFTIHSKENHKLETKEIKYA